MDVVGAEVRKRQLIVRIAVATPESEKQKEKKENIKIH